MKFLLVNKFHYKKGGAETYYFTLANGLIEKGHNVVFFSMKHINNEHCEQEKYFVSNKEYNKKTSILKKIKSYTSFVYSKEAYMKISELLDNEKPDIVILNNFHRQLTSSIVDAIYERKIKIIWVIHDLIALCPNYTMLDGDGKVCEDCCNGNYIGCLKKKCVKKSFFKSLLAVKEAKYNKKHNTYSKINLFITPSKFYKEKLVAYGFDASKIKYMRNPFSYSKSSVVDSLASDNYILYFGRLSYEKGLITLINSVAGTKYNLKIVGTGIIEDDLKKYVLENNIANVEFFGYKAGEELENIIVKSKCVVLPSEWYENGPYSALEAMNLGVPLIVSNLGGLPELVKNGENGYIFEHSDVQSLKKAIDNIFSLDNETYLKMKMATLKFARENFSLTNYIDRLMEVINEEIC